MTSVLSGWKFASVKRRGSLAIEGRNRLGGTFDGPTQRLSRKVGSVEKLGQQFVRRVLDHLDLFEDDLLLSL